MLTEAQERQTEMTNVFYLLFRPTNVKCINSNVCFVKYHYTCTLEDPRIGIAPTRQLLPDFIDCMYSHQLDNILFTVVTKIDTFYNVFNEHNLFVICNNQLCKHFNFINFIYFVTLTYKTKRLREDDINTSKHVRIIYEVDITVNLIVHLLV